MDPSNDAEVMTVLPQELRLGAPPTMPQARSYLFRQQSTLSAYNPDDQIQINIPRLQRSYLSKESYLQFRLNGQFQPATPVDQGNRSQYVPDLLLDDAGAWSLFERMEVFDYLGSTVLESTDALPQLVSLLVDMGSDFTDPNHEGAIAHGLSDPYIATNQNDNTSFFKVLSNNVPNQATFPYALNNPKINFNGTDYTWSSTTSYASFDTFLDALNTWLGTLDLNIFSQASSANKYGIDLFSTSSFTVNQAAGPPTGTANLINFLGLATTGATGQPTYTFPITSANAGQEIVSSTGIGKNFYCGGMSLASFGTSSTTSTTPRSFSVQFSIPIPSFLGFLSKKMVPLHNGFTIVLTLASKAKPMFMAAKQVPTFIFGPIVSSGPNVVEKPDSFVTNAFEPIPNVAGNVNAPSLLPDPTVFWWNITDVNMVCQILELGPVAESMILSSSQGQPLIVHSKQIRNYRGSTSSTSSEFYLPLNLNVASLTNILWFMRPDATENDLRYASVGGRIRNYLWRWEFQYGSTVLPQSQGIQCMAMSGPVVPSGITPFTGNDLGASQQNAFTECYNELLKSRPNDPDKGRLSYANFGTGFRLGTGQFISFGETPFRCSYNNGSTQEQSKFACGLNTELVSGKQGNMICGLNTNGMNTQIRGYFHPSYIASGNRAPSTIDAYAEYDAFINISPGIATTVSF